MEPVPETLADVLNSYCHVEIYNDAIDDLTEDVGRARAAGREWPGRFREQLASAILNASMTPEQFERVTGEDLPSSTEVTRRLQEIWDKAFPGEPVSP